MVIAVHAVAVQRQQIQALMLANWLRLDVRDTPQLRQQLQPRLQLRLGLAAVLSLEVAFRTGVMTE